MASPGAALRQGSLPGSGPSGRRWLRCFLSLLVQPRRDGGRGVVGEWVREEQASPPACARERGEKLGAFPVPSQTTSTGTCRGIGSTLSVLIENFNLSKMELFRETNY